MSEHDESAETVEQQPVGRKYALFTHIFMDNWEGREIEYKFRFAKPNHMLIKQMQKQAPRDSTLASRNVLVNTIHPEDKDAFIAAITEYPALINSFGNAVVRGVGVGEVGN